MKVCIEIPDKKIESYVKSVMRDLFGRKYERKDFERILKYVEASQKALIEENLYDTIKNAVDNYINNSD